MIDLQIAAKVVTAALTGACLYCGWRGLWLVKQAAQVSPEPAFTCEPGDATLSNMFWTAATMEATLKSSNLTGASVPWMMASLCFAAAAGIVGLLA